MKYVIKVMCLVSFSIVSDLLELLNRKVINCGF